VASHDTLLEAPRPSEVLLKQLDIMIGLKHEHVGGSDPLDHQSGCMPEIRQEANIASICSQQETDGVLGIMWDAEGVHADVGDVETGPGLKHMTCESHLLLELQRIECQAIAVDRNAQTMGNQGQSLDMIAVFVGDQDGGEVFRGTADTGQTLSDLTCAEACIH